MPRKPVRYDKLPDFGRAQKMLDALGATARLDPDMTLGRLQALLGVALYNSGLEAERLTVKRLWVALGGEDYCAYGSFAHQLKMLSGRRLADDVEGLGLVILNRGVADYREVYPTLSPLGLRLIDSILAALE